MKIGEYEIHALDGGFFRLDGGAMFGSIPKVIWQRVAPADEKNRVRLALRAMLIRGNGRVIMCESGIGDKWPPKRREIFAIEGGNEVLCASLARFGLAPGDLTDIIISHLHFDHSGGLTEMRDGTPVPAFPNATVHIQRRHWEWALARNLKEHASFLPENMLPLEEAGLLNLLDGPGELFPGIDLLTADGHTRGLQMTRVRGPEATLVFVADTIPTCAHIRLPFLMGYDVEAIRTLEEKRELLSQAVDENWILFFTHDPEVAACRVCRRGGDFEQDSKIGL